jgi:quercetin dioxygenase-like cupin family protein
MRGIPKGRGMEYGAAIIVGELASLELEEPSPAAAAVYDQPIALRLLYQDPGGGEEHYLVRYPAGLKGRRHLHAAAHTIVVLEGKLDANGRVVGPGSYAHFPAGQVMRHQAAGDAPCLFVLLFHGPFDVRLADEEADLQIATAPASPPAAPAEVNDPGPRTSRRRPHFCHHDQWPRFSSPNVTATLVHMPARSRLTCIG